MNNSAKNTEVVASSIQNRDQKFIGMYTALVAGSALWGANSFVATGIGRHNLDVAIFLALGLALLGAVSILWGHRSVFEDAEKPQSISLREPYVRAIKYLVIANILAFAGIPLALAPETFGSLSGWIVAASLVPAFCAARIYGKSRIDITDRKLLPKQMIKSILTLGGLINMK